MGALLQEGLRHCSFNETLLINALRHFERCCDISGARRLLAQLQTRSIQRTWRVLLEAALLEGRMGNVAMARQVFQYVMASPGVRYGPVFLEATRFEERIGQQARAVELASNGLARVPHYGRWKKDRAGGGGASYGWVVWTISLQLFV